MDELRSRVGLRIAGLVLILVNPTWAGEGGVKLERATLPAPFLPQEGDAIDRTIEASAVEAIGDGRLVLVGHDKDVALHVVELATGRRIGPPLTSPRLGEAARIGAKWEAMAHDDEGAYYGIGSQPGDPATGRPNVTWLVRFRLHGDGPPG